MHAVVVTRELAEREPDIVKAVYRGFCNAKAAMAEELEHGMTFNSYALVIHAVLMNQGVALGWTPLTDDLLATWQLVRLLEAPVVTTRGYFLVCPQARPEAPAVPLFRRWLFEECTEAA